jgi:hypothetical protein
VSGDGRVDEQISAISTRLEGLQDRGLAAVQQLVRSSSSVEVHQLLHRECRLELTLGKNSVSVFDSFAVAEELQRQSESWRLFKRVENDVWHVGEDEFCLGVQVDFYWPTGQGHHLTERAGHSESSPSFSIHDLVTLDEAFQVVLIRRTMLVPPHSVEELAKMSLSFGTLVCRR